MVNLEDAPDPEALLREADEFSRNFLKEKRVVLTNQTTKPFYEDNSNIAKNFGYTFLSAIYDALKLDIFFSQFKKQFKYDPNQMFKYLVISRLMNPDSKRATFQSIREYYGLSFNYSLQQIYRSLDFISDVKTDMQVYLNKQIKKLIGRNCEKIFYDVTNYYFEKDFEDYDFLIEVDKVYTKEEMKKNDIIEIEENGIMKQYKVIKGYCKNGVSKENRLTPIIQSGLFIDENGIPIAMQIFPGNTSDCKTLQPVMKEVKEKFNLNRLIVVADKGLNTSDNIAKIIEKGDGYMFSQVLKGKKGMRFHERLFNESLYTVVNEDYKYQTYEEDCNVKLSNGEIKTIRQKVLIYYSAEDAKREKAKRNIKIEKARNSLSNNAYRIDHSFQKYLKECNYVKLTGECADGKEYILDNEKISEEEKYDGYFCIITSETEMSEQKIRETYHGLWRIEETFRITKNDLSLRPIYLRTRKHIEAHFQICFVALTIIRLLQYKMKYSLSVERIIRALNMCACVSANTGIIHALKVGEKIGFKKATSKDGKEYLTLSADEISETIQDLQKIEKAFNIKMCTTLNNKTVFDKFLRDIKFESCLAK